MDLRARGVRYLLGALALALVLGVVQLVLPLTVPAPPMSDGVLTVVSTLMFWLGIPGVAGLLTAGIVLIELARRDRDT